jgi:nucleoid-associated protein YgaU
MGLFGSSKDEEQKKKQPPDFSNVVSGGSSTAPPPASPQAPAARRTYTVQKGDSLSKIAEREYGDAKEWHRIFEANKDIISDPDLIYPGQTLKLP